jgi:uncharacterized protein (TIGR02271 family)
MKTVVALFDSMSDAQNAVRDLVNTGISRERITLVANNREGRSDLEDVRSTTMERGVNESYEDDVDAGGGAAAGAVVGGIGGAVLALSAFAIPGIGPVIAAGPLIAGLVGAGVGAAVGGLVGALIEAGIPEEHAGYYAEGVRRGSTLLAVEADDSRVDDVVDIMNRYDPIDINERVAGWRTSGWTGFDPNAGAYNNDQGDFRGGKFTNRDYSTSEGASSRYEEYTTEDLPNRTQPATMGAAYATSGGAYPTEETEQMQTGGVAATTTTTDYNRNLEDEGEVHIDVVEEDLRVGKRQTEGGGVRVQTHVVEQPVEEQVRLREEEVHVERRPVDRPASSGDLNAFKEGSFEVNAVREEAVVEKQPRVVEEVVIKKDARERTETVRDTVRRTEVDVDQQHSGFNTADWQQYDTGFRNHFQSSFANRGYTYDQYEPAYRYGYTLANDARYQGRDWNAIEADARTHWSQNYHDSPWEDFKDAIRYGWQRVTGKA